MCWIQSTVVSLTGLTDLTHAWIADFGRILVVTIPISALSNLSVSSQVYEAVATIKYVYQFLGSGVRRPLRAAEESQRSVCVHDAKRERAIAVNKHHE